MRRAQIKPGTMYARHSNWGAPTPVVLLTSEPHAVNRYGDHARGKAPAGARVGRRSYTGTAGYPALISGGAPGSTVSWEDRLAALEAADPETELARWLAGEPPSAEGLSFELVTSLAKVNGGYRNEHTAYVKARNEASRARSEAETARRQGETRAAAALAGLRDATITLTGHADALKAWRSHQSSIMLYPEDAELIAGLLRELAAARQA